MRLSPEEARNVVHNDHEDWEKIESKTDGNDRWSIFWTGVFLHKPSGKHYQFDWSVGATGYQQDEQPYEYEKVVEPVEVKRIEIIKLAWKPVQEKKKMYKKLSFDGKWIYGVDCVAEQIWGLIVIKDTIIVHSIVSSLPEYE